MKSKLTKLVLLSALVSGFSVASAFAGGIETLGHGGNGNAPSTEASGSGSGGNMRISGYAQGRCTGPGERVPSGGGIGHTGTHFTCLK